MTRENPTAEQMEKFEAEIDAAAAYLVETFEWLGLPNASMDQRQNLICEIADKLKECFEPWL